MAVKKLKTMKSAAISPLGGNHFFLLCVRIKHFKPLEDINMKQYFKAKIGHFNFARAWDILTLP